MPMTPLELRRILKRLQLSQSQAAHRLGVNPRTLRRWIAGDSRTPESVALLLHSWLKGK